MPYHKIVVVKDAPSYAVGGGGIGYFSLSDAATIAQQVGMILGAILVAATLLHRVIMIRRDTRK